MFRALRESRWLGPLLLGTLWLSLATARATADDAAAPSSPRPNFLIILSDDQSQHDNGCYGNPAVRTPHIDRLATQGLRFTTAFTGTAMCSPSRSMMFTGLYPVRNGAFPNHSQIRGGVKTLPAYLGGLGYRVGLAGKVHVGPRPAFPFEYMPRARIGRFLGQASDVPFCLIVATNDPHKPWRKNTDYEPEKLPLPPQLVDTPETRAALADYYTDVTAMDTEVGDCLAELERHGHADDTLVIYASDHGAQFPFGKWTCYDEGLKVPFIVRWPDVIKPGTTSDAMIHFVDVLPTLLDLAGGDVPDGLDGRSFAGVLRGETDQHHDVVYGVHTTRGIIAGSECYPVRSIRTRTHQYILNLQPEAAFRNTLIASDKTYWPSWLAAAKHDPWAARRVQLYQHRPAEELYDLQSDPHQLKNLADDPAHAEMKATLSTQLRAWMEKQGDQGSATERQTKPHRTGER